MRLRSALWLAAAVAASTASLPLCAAEPPVESDPQTMMTRIAEHWRETQSAEGFLPYGFDFLSGHATDEPTSRGYIVRQAGAFFAWAMYYGYTRDDRYREPIRRGIAAFAQRSLPIGKSRAQRWLEATRILSAPAGRLTLAALLSKFDLLYERTGTGSVVSADGEYGGAWTGATALALLAELTYSKASGDNRFSDVRAAWRDGLLSLRIPGSGFRETPASIDDSDYFNGETWLALAVYADLHRGDQALLRALPDIDRVLIERYTRRPSNTFYQWGAMAAAQRWRTTRDPRFVEYLQRQAEVFADRFERQLSPGGNHCAAMEGVAATLAVFAESGVERSPATDRLRALLSREMATLPGLQIQPGQTRIPMGADAHLAAPRLADFSGAFLFGSFRPETRVDAAQHCLSALLLMAEPDRRGRAPSGMPRPTQR